MLTPMEDPHEVARRVRAALAYAGMNRPTAAKILNVSVPTLARITGSTGTEPRGADPRALWRLADACGLPREWFSFQLDQLHLAVIDGPAFTRPADPRDHLLGLLEERAGQDGRSHRRDSPSPTSEDDPGPRREAG